MEETTVACRRGLTLEYPPRYPVRCRGLAPRRLRFDIRCTYCTQVFCAMQEKFLGLLETRQSVVFVHRIIFRLARIRGFLYGLPPEKLAPARRPGLTLNMPGDQ